jgi:hypothetical protein
VNTPRNEPYNACRRTRLCRAPDAGVNGTSIMRPTLTLTISLVLLVLYGCNPNRNSGDLIVGSNAAGQIRTNATMATFTALYGIEVGHPDSKRSEHLLVALFILLPEDDVWKYSGGGSIARPLYYRLFGHARWLFYPQTVFVAVDKSGHFSERSERSKVNWKFDGRDRSITIAGVRHPVSAGSFVIVKFDKKWDPEVGVGEQSFDKLRINLKTRLLLLECFEGARLGIGALTNACSRPR